MNIVKTKSFYWQNFGAVLIIIITASFSLEAQAISFNLKSLKPNQEMLQVKNDLPTVAMIYQPDCSWCKKQGKSLAKAFEHCQASVNVFLVGAKGNARQLKRELTHYHKDIPAYHADRKFLRNIGGYQASPTTLIFDAQGELIAKKRGFIPTQKMTSALTMISQGLCHI